MSEQLAYELVRAKTTIEEIRTERDALAEALKGLMDWLDEDYPTPEYSREVKLRQAARAALARGGVE